MPPNKDKLFFIWSHDRSVVIEIDLRTTDFRMTERRCAHPKNIDLAVVGNNLIVLNKDGWVEVIDHTKKPKVKLPKKKGKLGDKESPKEIDSDDEETSITYQLTTRILMLNNS